MAKQVKGTKSGKTWLTAFSGVNIKTPAVAAANILTDNDGAIKMLRATASEAMLTVGRACAKSGDIESVNHAAHWFAVQRIEDGIAEGTASKEASQLRAVCRACFGGVKVQRKLEENSTLYTHDFAALARKVTPKAFQKQGGKGGGSNRVKSSVTDKEFANMVKWARLLSDKQRKVIDAIFAKVDAQAAAEESGKVVRMHKKAA